MYQSVEFLKVFEEVFQH